MIDLSHFDTEFELADADGFQRLDDGQYNAVIEKMSILENAKGVPVVHWWLSLPSEQFSITKKSYLTSKALHIFKKELSRCGIKLGKLSDLQESFPLFVGLPINIRVRNREGFPPNIDILGLG